MVALEQVALGVDAQPGLVSVLLGALPRLVQLALLLLQAASHRGGLLELPLDSLHHLHVLLNLITLPLSGDRPPDFAGRTPLQVTAFALSHIHLVRCRLELGFPLLDLQLLEVADEVLLLLPDDVRHELALG